MKAPLPLLCLLLALPPLHAQQAPGTVAEPPELAQARQQATLRAMAAGRTLAEQFSNALTAIAREVGQAGDYDQAAAALRRRDELAQLYTAQNGDPNVSNTIILKPADARVSGAVSHDRQLNVLTGWKAVGSVATWEVNRIRPGAYEATLTYASADVGDAGRTVPILGLGAPDLSTGGDIEFYEDSSLAGASQNRRTAQISSTGGWTTFTTLTLPAIQLTRSSARLALKVTRTRGNGGVMVLKEVRLAPPKPAVAEGETPSPDEFAALQEAHSNRLKQAIATVLTPYTSHLKSLADQAVATNDTDLAEDLRDEAERAAALLENPERLLGSKPRTGSAGPSPGEGFKELSGATYVPSPREKGDRFMVSHAGQEFPVRLLWVTCPPTLPEENKELESHAAYFKITPEDALVVGRRAQKFTSEFLKDKPLSLFTRGAKDEDGALLVEVRPEGLGTFAGVLVDNGLASIVPLPSRGRPGRRQEEGIVQALKDREAAARARAIPPGAWALAEEEEK